MWVRRIDQIRTDSRSVRLVPFFVDVLVEPAVRLELTTP